MSQFIIHDLHEEFFNHVHATHAPKQHLSERDQRPKSKKLKEPLCMKRSKIRDFSQMDKLLKSSLVIRSTTAPMSLQERIIPLLCTPMKILCTELWA